MAGTAAAVGGVLFTGAMGWLLVDALTARQGPGEIPKLVGVVVLMPVVAVGALVIGLAAGTAVAPFRLGRDDPARRPAFGIAVVVVTAAIAIAVQVAWSLRGGS